MDIKFDVNALAAQVGSGLDAVVGKLGTTLPELLKAGVRWEYAQGIANLALAALSLVVAVAMAFVSVKAWKHHQQENGKSYDDMPVGLIVSIVVTAASVVLVFYFTFDGIVRLVAPEGALIHDAAQMVQRTASDSK